jgi:hypothetical protein
MEIDFGLFPRTTLRLSWAFILPSLAGPMLAWVIHLRRNATRRAGLLRMTASLRPVGIILGLGGIETRTMQVNGNGPEDSSGPLI